MNIFFYDNSFMFRSQDVQSVLDDSSVSDTSLKTNKKGQESPFNTLQNEKKVILIIFLTVIHCY